jgi:hypothetical protein
MPREKLSRFIDIRGRHCFEPFFGLFDCLLHQFERAMRRLTGSLLSAVHLATPLARQHAVLGRSSVPVE